MSRRKSNQEPENRPIRRTYLFDPEIVIQISQFVAARHTAIDPWTMAKVFDEAIRDFFAKHAWPHPNGASPHRKKPLRAAS